MFKKPITIMVFAIVLIMVGSNLSAEIHKISIKEAQDREKIPDEMNVQYDGPTIPYIKGTAVSKGIRVGTTYYDYQTNGSTGTRIAKHNCGVHISWMNGIINHTGERAIYYNFIDISGDVSWGDVGTPVSTGTRAGYTTLARKTSTGDAIIVWHENGNQCKAAVDAGCGLGLFTLYDVPSSLPAQNPLIWPYIAYDFNGNLQITNTESSPSAGDPQAVAYTRSSNEGMTWTGLALYDSDPVYDIAGQPVSSPVDGKVAIVYSKPIQDGSEPNQTNNDVVYIESPDGVSWNFNNIHNVTNYQWDDTIRAYTDLDACYDYNSNLHILWNTPYYNADSGNISIDACLLWHWSEATGMNLVYNAWHPSYPGTWNRSASKMSISAREDGALYALWTHFDDVDVSAGGYSNGELYLSYSIDGGINWTDPTNVTNSPSPGCSPGNCNSDHWSSLAEQVEDGFLYITYIEDKDAGGIPQTEGTSTQNIVRYLRVPDLAPPYAPFDVSIKMCPHNPPIVVPAGGSFTYTGGLVNETDVATTADVSIFVFVPNYGLYGPLQVIYDIPLAPYDTLVAYFLTQQVPIYAPAGYYVYYAYCGNYPSQQTDMDSFQFVVTQPAEGDNDNWNLSKWFGQETEVLPSATVLRGNFPNPFNARTNITFDLSENGFVKLEIYNLLGQKVETLIDGASEAGRQSVVWDASNYPSGVYFLKLTANNQTFTKRMTLLK